MTNLDIPICLVRAKATTVIRYGISSIVQAIVFSRVVKIYESS